MAGIGTTTTGTVRRILDAETIDLSDGRRVRLAGVSVHPRSRAELRLAWGKLKRLLPEGTSVQVEQRAVFYYGELIAEVRRLADGLHVNQEMRRYLGQ